jgi:MOSC domain-containing protein
MSVAATVSELWRYPVKSLLGEQLDHVDVDERGIVGDRLFAVTDRIGKLGSGKTSRRFRLLEGLFDLRARGDAAAPLVELPDGRELAVGDSRLDEFLSGRYGDDLRVARESSVSHHDAAPLHLLTTSSLRWLAERLPTSSVDRRRFRPNVLLDGGAAAELLEDSWVGSRFALGSAVIRVRDRTDRCVMTTNAQSELPQDPAILRAVTEHNDTFLGVFADVERPGAVRVGDPLVRL